MSLVVANPHPSFPAQPSHTTSTLERYSAFSIIANAYYSGSWDMRVTPEEIVATYDRRRMDLGPYLEKCKTLLAHYENAVIAPLPELDDNEVLAIANYFTQGIDQHAGRIASVMPMWEFPATAQTDVAKKRARRRKMAAMGWIEANNMDLKLYSRARQFITYANSPVMLQPNKTTSIPEWIIKDPFSSFPSPMVNHDDMIPDDCIFDFDRTWGWLKKNYPVVDQLRRGSKIDDDTIFTLLKYVDDHECVVVVVGDRTGMADPSVVAGPRGRQSSMSAKPKGGWSGTLPFMELERYPNRAGVTPVAVPGRLSLDQPMGQFDSMIGLFQLQSQLMALEVNAIMQGVYTDTWVVARPNEEPEIITQADGLRGVTGQIKGGDLQWKQEAPTNYVAFQLSDRLERVQKQNGLIPSEYGGEGGGTKTGKRGDAILSAVVDFPLQEAQRVLARSLQAETKIAIAIAKGYHGNQAKSFYVGWKGAKGNVEYTPNKDFDTDNVRVSYAQPGSDLMMMTTHVGQLVSLELMSKTTARKVLPSIADDELEADLVVKEGLTAAVMAAIQQQANSGELPWPDLLEIVQQVESDKKELIAAAIDQQRKAQERQAAQVEATDPAAQPGMAMPGMGAEAGIAPTVAPPADSLTNMAAIAGQLTRPDQVMTAAQNRSDQRRQG